MLSQGFKKPVLLSGLWLSSSLIFVISCSERPERPDRVLPNDSVGTQEPTQPPFQEPALEPNSPSVVTEVPVTTEGTAVPVVVEVTEVPAEITALNIVSSLSSLELGQTLALTLETIDSREQRKALPNNKAKWSSNNDFVTVTSNGVVSATQTFEGVVITARFEKFTAKFKFNITGKSCGTLKDGERSTSNRFADPIVPFNELCKPIEVDSICENGSLKFDESTSDSCSVAVITHMESNPASLFIDRGETAKVELFFIDELGNQFPLVASEAKWEIPAGILHSEGRITASDDLANGVNIKASANGFDANIFVRNSASKPKIDSFKTSKIVMKEGDEQTLEINSSGTLVPENLNWSSSDSKAISVNQGRVKALKAGSEAVISARLGDQKIETKIVVEKILNWSIEPVIFETFQKDKVHPLTQDKPQLFPAFIVELSEVEPKLSNVTPSCVFEIRQNRGKWELDVELDEKAVPIPNYCEADLTAETAAGQKLSQRIQVPVDYNRITVKELNLEESQLEGKVADITLQMSSSYSVSSLKINALTDVSTSTCEWTAVETEKGYEIRVNRSSTETCASQVVLKMKDENDGLVLTKNELLVASNYKTFEDQCLAPDNDAVATTVKAIRTEIGPSLSCDRISALLRSRNLSAISGQKSLALALDNKGLTDLKPLARMLGFTELSLAANRQLSDITPLRDLKRLKLTNLKFTIVKDFSPIYGHEFQNDLRLPANTVIPCNSAIMNFEINKICQE